MYVFSPIAASASSTSSYSFLASVDDDAKRIKSLLASLLPLEYELRLVAESINLSLLERLFVLGNAVGV